MSGFIGVIVFLFGLFPILEALNVLNLGVTALYQSSVFIAALPYVLAALGFYLAIEAVIELTNSNSIGWLSFLIGIVIMVVGILPVLAGFGILPAFLGFTLPVMAYYVIFTVEGLFLMIAMFAMEL